MKLFSWSWLLGMLSYVFLGVVRRSGFPATGAFIGTAGIITLLLLLLSAGTGIVLGVLSWNRKEVKSWWTISAILLNLVVLLTVINRLFAG